MRIGRWSESRFVLVCQLVEVMREADVNETSLELLLFGSLVGKSQLSQRSIRCLSHMSSFSTTPSGVNLNHPV